MGAWRRAAEKARAISEGQPSGLRERLLQPIATASGRSVQSLKRAMTALTFCDEFRKAGGADLDEQSLATVEIIRRWYAYDRLGALAAGDKLFTGGHTVETLICAEKLARPPGGRRVGGSRLDRARQREAAIAVVDRVFSGFTVETRDGPERGLIDVKLTGARDGRAVSAAALIYFESERHSDGARRLNELVLRAMGLRRLFDEVLLVAERGQSEEILAAWRRRHPQQMAELQVEHMAPARGPGRDAIPRRGARYGETDRRRGRPPS